MEELPKFEQLSDAGLERLMHELTEQEAEISLERRKLHGKLDILRAERTARMKGGSLKPVRVDVLAGILARRTPPDGWHSNDSPSDLAF